MCIFGYTYTYEDATLIINIYLTVLFTIAYILYLALEEGSPLFKQINPFYLFSLSTFIHTNCRISFDFFSLS